MWSWVCVYTWLCVYRYACVCKFDCVCVCKPEDDTEYLQMPSTFFETRSHWPTIPPVGWDDWPVSTGKLPSQIWDYKHLSPHQAFLCMGSEDWTQVFVFKGNHFTKWTTSYAWIELVTCCTTAISGCLHSPLHLGSFLPSLFMSFLSSGILKTLLRIPEIWILVIVFLSCSSHKIYSVCLLHFCFSIMCCQIDCLWAPW